MSEVEMIIFQFKVRGNQLFESGIHTRFDKQGKLPYVGSYWYEIWKEIIDQ